MARDLPALRTTARLQGPPLRRMAAAGLGAALVAAMALLYRPAAPAGNEADGLFANDCCGTLELRGGSLVLNGKKTTHYAVGRDARGPFVLPYIYVGSFEPVGFEVNGRRPPARLRLDHLPHPDRVLLYQGRNFYLFARKQPPPVPR